MESASLLIRGEMKKDPTKLSGPFSCQREGMKSMPEIDETESSYLCAGRDESGHWESVISL